MINSYIKKMEEKIKGCPFGMCFVISDFTNDMDYETAKKSIARLEKKGIIRRVTRGVYDRPKFSQLLNEMVAPDINEVAKAIARSFNWTISASGNTALNLLGLSTQVPSMYEFITSGPSRNYVINGIIIKFTHRADKEIYGFSYKTSLVIQALKQYGREAINSELINRISCSLDDSEKECLLKEAQQSTIWIYEIVKTICEVGNV